MSLKMRAQSLLEYRTPPSDTAGIARYLENRKG